jgi:hypothetical protein
MDPWNVIKMYVCMYVCIQRRMRLEADHKWQPVKNVERGGYDLFQGTIQTLTLR